VEAAQVAEFWDFYRANYRDLAAKAITDPV
jgi:hypothetical protein